MNQNTKWILTGAIAVAATAGGLWLVGSGEQAKAPVEGPAAKAPTDEQKVNAAPGQRSFELLHANWGPVHFSDVEPPKPDPNRGTPEQIARERFAREAAERWQGTEIFVLPGRIQTADNARPDQMEPPVDFDDEAAEPQKAPVKDAKEGDK